MYVAGIVIFNITGLFLWALVRGAALCRSDEAIKLLDDEQMFILSEIRKGSV